MQQAESDWLSNPDINTMGEVKAAVMPPMDPAMVAAPMPQFDSAEQARQTALARQDQLAQMSRQLGAQTAQAATDSLPQRIFRAFNAVQNQNAPQGLGQIGPYGVGMGGLQQQAFMQQMGGYGGGFPPQMMGGYGGGFGGFPPQMMGGYGGYGPSPFMGGYGGGFGGGYGGFPPQMMGGYGGFPPQMMGGYGGGFPPQMMGGYGGGYGGGFGGGYGGFPPQQMMGGYGGGYGGQGGFDMSALMGLPSPYQNQMQGFSQQPMQTPQQNPYASMRSSYARPSPFQQSTPFQKPNNPAPSMQGQTGPMSMDMPRAYGQSDGTISSMQNAITNRGGGGGGGGLF